MLNVIQQPWFQIGQFPQLVGISWVILVVALADIWYFPRVRHIDFVPTSLHGVGYPSRLCARFDGHRASRDACEIALELCLLHPQSQPLADLTVFIKNTNLGVLVPKVNADVERELLSRSILGRDLLVALTLFFRLLLAVILFHSRSPLLHVECVPLGAYRIPRETGVSFHLPRVLQPIPKIKRAGRSDRPAGRGHARVAERMRAALPSPAGSPALL